MGTIINPKEVKHGLTLEPKLTQSSTINIGNSGSMKVDPRFQLDQNNPVSGQQTNKKNTVHYGGISRKNPVMMNPVADILHIVGLSQNFKYSLTKKGKGGKPVTIVDAMKHTETNSSVTDFYTGHLMGQTAAKIALELQQRYRNPATIQNMKKLTPQQIRDDRMKIAFLTAFLNSNKLKRIYSNPKMIDAKAGYPIAKTTYLPLFQNDKYRKSIQELIENHNRGFQLLREDAELSALSHYDSR